MDREEARELIRDYVGKVVRPVTDITPVNKRNPEHWLFPDWPPEKEREQHEEGLD